MSPDWPQTTPPGVRTAIRETNLSLAEGPIIEAKAKKIISNLGSTGTEADLKLLPDDQAQLHDILKATPPGTADSLHIRLSGSTLRVTAEYPGNTHLLLVLAPGTESTIRADGPHRSLILKTRPVYKPTTPPPYPQTIDPNKVSLPSDERDVILDFLTTISVSHPKSDTLIG